MKKLNELKSKLAAMQHDFENQYNTLVVSGEMSISDFAAITLDLVKSIVTLEKAIKELSSGTYHFNENNTVSVTYLSHFRNGLYHHDIDYKTVTMSFYDCIISLKSLNIDKCLLLKCVSERV